MYEEEIEAAYQLIKEAGTTIALTRYSGGTFNSEDGSYSGRNREDYNLNAVILPVSSSFTGTKVGEEFSEELIVGNTKTVLASAKGSTTEPKVGDVVTFSGKTWVVIGADTLAPDGASKILYNLVVKIAA